MATTAPSSSGNNGLMVVIAVALIAVIAVAAVYLMQDHRTGGERFGDAVEALPSGVDKAANKLDDQPPAQNVQRNLNEAGDKVERKLN